MLELIKKWKFFGLIILLVVLLLLARSCGSSDTVSPAEATAKESWQPISAIGDFFGNIFDFSTKNALQKEVDELNAEVAELKTATQISDDVADENDSLRELLELKEENSTGWSCVAAEVTGREADNWYEKLTLNKGSNDGIEENMAVVNQDGLVGKIVNVTKNTSEVQLIIDSGGALGGMLQQSSIEGVLQGIGGGKGLITMTKLPYNADIQLNEVVVTSGVAGVFPVGLLVGTVVKVNTSADGLSKEAIIDPYCDFDNIKFVLVVHALSEQEIAAKEAKAENSDDENGEDSEYDEYGDDTETDHYDDESGEDEE